MEEAGLVDAVPRDEFDRRIKAAREVKMKNKKNPLRKSVVSNEVIDSVDWPALSRTKEGQALPIRQARPRPWRLYR